MNPILRNVRKDLPGRFNEIDLLRREWERVVATFSGEIVPPFEVLIHPSSACNLLCVWCIGDHVPIVGKLGVLEAAKTSDERLPDALAKPENMLKVIEDIIGYRKTLTCERDGVTVRREFQVESVSFSGLIGEPLVAKAAVVAAMQRLVEAERRTGIFTNGVMMDESTWDVLVRCAYVHVSVDAGTPETYGRIKFAGRPHGSQMFERALANLRELVRRRASTPGSPLAINTSFVLYPENFHEVYRAARILKDLGVDTLRIKQDNSAKRLLGDEDRVVAQALLDRIEAELVDERFRLIQIHRLSDPSEMQRGAPACHITDLMAAIGSDGHLYPCNYHPRPNGATYGSAITDGFAAVWEGARRAATRCQLPSICPKVCDPYKNRSNRMLHGARAAFAADGVSGLERHRDELFASLSD
jgi:MoaA/NifB/PqqE/SkfB family radical SAM enzyme